MINRRLQAILAILTLLAPSAVSAQDEDVWSLALSPAACPKESAQAVDLRALLASPQSYKGKCIRVSGVAVLRTLYVDGRVPAGRDEDVPPGDRLGLYGDLELLHRLGPLPQPVEITGMMSGRCEEGRYGAGYCHYVSKGSFMIVSDITIGHD